MSKVLATKLLYLPVKTLISLSSQLLLWSSEKLIFKNLDRKGRKDRIYNVPQTVMNAVLKNTIMFVHAFTGCDSTSALFSKEKIHFWELNQQSSELQAVIVTFSLPIVSPDLILHSRCTAFLIVYEALKEEKSLNNHCFTLFKWASDGSVIHELV